MPTEPQQPDYLAPYQRAANDTGTGFSATLWANRQSQRLRFQAFTDELNLAGKRVLDAGCGHGDFAAYLLDHRIDYDAFIGVDGVPEVLGAARARNLPRSTWRHADLARDAAALCDAKPDVVTLSGTLNTMPLATAIDTLAHCFAACREALIFNFLPTTHGPDAPPQEAPANRLDTHALLDWAFAQTWAVRYRQDYYRQAHDATIVMRVT